MFVLRDIKGFTLFWCDDMKNKKESFFWTSYSDLMTSLFFVILVLFVLSLVLVRNNNQELVRTQDELERVLDSLKDKNAATEAQLAKITELEKSIQNIDTRYFEYNDEYKTHILKTEVQFENGSPNIMDLSEDSRKSLLAVRDLLRDSISAFCERTPDADFFLIIEGQASRDSFTGNNELSYKRALSLFKFWFPNQNETSLRFYNLPCEVIIAGSGCMEGKPRNNGNERANQRFLIRILPKPGVVKSIDQ